MKIEKITLQYYLGVRFADFITFFFFDDFNFILAIFSPSDFSQTILVVST